MEGSGETVFVLPLPPVAPHEFTGDCRVAAERAYPGLMDRYFSICESIVKLFGDGRVSVLASDSRSLCGRHVCAGDGSACCMSCSTRGGYFESRRGHVTGVGVGRECHASGDGESNTGHLSEGTKGQSGVREGARMEWREKGGGCADVLGRGFRGGDGGSANQSSIPCGGAVRGPNYFRNQANRLKKKTRKQNAAVYGGFFSGCDDEVQLALRDTRAKLLVLENERRIVEEERKIARLKSPVQLAEDAVALVKLAERATKSAGSSKVAGWAATVVEGASVDVAKSAPSSVPSLESIKTTGSRTEKLKKKTEAVAAKKWAVVENPLSELEQTVISMGVMSVEAVVDARRNGGRKLHISDFLKPSCPYELSTLEKMRLREASGERVYG